jgi:hypothetical protein
MAEYSFNFQNFGQEYTKEIWENINSHLDNTTIIISFWKSILIISQVILQHSQ